MTQQAEKPSQSDRVKFSPKNTFSSASGEVRIWPSNEEKFMSLIFRNRIIYKDQNSYRVVQDLSLGMTNFNGYPQLRNFLTEKLFAFSRGAPHKRPWAMLVHRSTQEEKPQGLPK